MLTAHTFHDLMGKSPLPSLQQHLALAVEAAEQIPLLLDAKLESSRGDFKALGFKVSNLVQQAELIQAELVRDWPKGVLIPIRRRDLISVLESQEQILYASRQISALLHLPLKFPLEVYQLLLSLAERSVKTCGRVLRVSDSLDAVIRSGLTGPDVSRIYGLVAEVRSSNNGTWELIDDLRATLHEQCRDSDAVSLVFMLDLIRLLGELSAHADRAASRALLLVSR